MAAENRDERDQVVQGRSAAAQGACDRAVAAASGGDRVAALQFYEYAQRLAPSDGEITLSIGALRLAMQDPRSTEALTLIAQRDDVAEAWLGLAAAHQAMGEHDLAARDLRTLLARHGYVRGAANNYLHDAITLASGSSCGWCALSADGRLHVTLLDPAADMQRVTILRDGAPVGARPQRTGQDQDRLRAVYRLPNDWRNARHISVCLKGRHLLGSAIEASVIGQVEGFVSDADGGLSGWAWHPHDPDMPPTLVVRGANGSRLRIVAADPAPEVQHARPLARPRKFEVPAIDVRALSAPIAVQDAAGRNLFGSPLDPFAAQRSAAGAAELARRLYPASPRRITSVIDMRLPSVPADIVGVRKRRGDVVRAPGVDVVIPVYRGHAQTVSCIDSVLASLPAGAHCIVVEDASPEPKLVEELQHLARHRRIVLFREPTNRGFPATANAGIRAACERDVILLNSDTLVPPGWIERLTDAAYSGPDIGTVTPLSNDATVFSYPLQDGPNPIPDKTAMARLDRLAQRANGHAVEEVPTAHGFCVYLRRDCLNEVGLFREDLFAQGYGEENDFCIRARHLGWRHVAAPGVFVGHAGTISFGGAKGQLKARNLAVLNRLHPGYDALIARFRGADPLARSRFRMDALRWRARCSRNGAVVIISHSREGGVKRRVAERCKDIAASGLRPIVLSPVRNAEDRAGCRLADASGHDFPNLRFDTSEGLAELVAFLQHDKPVSVELHHFVGHDPALFGLAGALGVPYDVVIHDYAWVCPRITLVGPEKRYCGEPGWNTCEACYTDLGGNIEEDINPSRLRSRSQGVLGGARRVIVPSQDVAARLKNYFPKVRYVVTPWEKTVAPLRRAGHRVSRLRLRVAVVGAIGIDKGYDYLLACARHVAAQRIALEFVVVGHTCDDKRLLDTGVVQITGGYEEAEAVELIRAQEAELGFLPALWPETWSYTLSQMWQAGLEVLAFDLGAQADRIRETGRGSVLPLNLPPAAACRALLAHRTGGGALQPAELARIAAE
jgi:GT2 family glycosyltransferase